ncbi:MAG TPA: ATP-binding protein, partial [Patescibacteria group bacterium]|nr:ATP-binding protein [Patescibacteria group bacterium]
VDQLQMRMVFENLLDNANKYSPKGGDVTVNINTKPKKIIIKVQDQGIGIARTDISKLFHKFSRINNPKSIVGGTGLGLYWAKKLVELHNGTIKASSQLGKGTTFTVTIPYQGANA